MLETFDLMAEAMRNHHQGIRENRNREPLTVSAEFIESVIFVIGNIVSDDDPARIAFEAATQDWRDRFFWAPLGKHLERYSPGIAVLSKAESPIEKKFYQEMLCAGIDGYEFQYPIFGYRLDVAFPALKLAVELDGYEFHSSKEARNNDTARDRKFSANGWAVVRFTGSQIFQSVDSCIGELIGILEARKLTLAASSEAVA